MSPRRWFRQWRLQHLIRGRSILIQRLGHAVRAEHFDRLNRRLDWYDARIARLKGLLK